MAQGSHRIESDPQSSGSAAFAAASAALTAAFCKRSEMVLCCAVPDAAADVNARTRMPFRKASPPDTWLPFDDAPGKPANHNPNGRIPGGRAPAPLESL